MVEAVASVVPEVDRRAAGVVAVALVVLVAAADSAVAAGEVAAAGLAAVVEAEAVEAQARRQSTSRAHFHKCRIRIPKAPWSTSCR